VLCGAEVLGQPPRGVGAGELDLASAVEQDDRRAGRRIIGQCADQAPAYVRGPQRTLEAEIRRLQARIVELEREKTDVEAFAAVAAHELLPPLVMTEAYAATVCERTGEERHADSRRDLETLGRARRSDAAARRGAAARRPLQRAQAAARSTSTSCCASA
jgi:signal transduction histidine kinase